MFIILSHYLLQVKKPESTSCPFPAYHTAYLISKGVTQCQILLIILSKTIPYRNSKTAAPLAVLHVLHVLPTVVLHALPNAARETPGTTGPGIAGTIQAATGPGDSSGKAL